MKKILLFALLLSCSFNAAFAQIINRPIDRAIDRPVVLKPKMLPTLKVNVTVMPNITVKDHWQHTDLCSFKIIQALVNLARMGEKSTGFGGCRMVLTEIKGFQVTANNLLTPNADGSKTYSFDISGLKAQQEYGIDLILNTEYLVPQPGYALVVNNAATSTDCRNLSVMGGKIINIVIGSGPIPR